MVLRGALREKLREPAGRRLSLWEGGRTLRHQRTPPPNCFFLSRDSLEKEERVEWRAADLSEGVGILLIEIYTDAGVTGK